MDFHFFRSTFAQFENAYSGFLSMFLLLHSPTRAQDQIPNLEKITNSITDGDTVALIAT